MVFQTAKTIYTLLSLMATNMPLRSPCLILNFKKYYSQFLLPSGVNRSCVLHSGNPSPQINTDYWVFRTLTKSVLKRTWHTGENGWLEAPPKKVLIGKVSNKVSYSVMPYAVQYRQPQPQFSLLDKTASLSPFTQ